AFMLVARRLTLAMFSALGLGRPAAAASTARQHPPAQAVGPLNCGRDIYRKRTEIATVEYHRPATLRRVFDPSTSLVVDRPGHSGAGTFVAFRKVVQRRLQLLVHGQAKAEPDEVVKATRKRRERQGQREEEGDRDARDQTHGSSSA